MVSRITVFLTQNPSYLKWGKERLANKFNCSPRTISNIVKNLSDIKENYLRKF
jgi:hypothetical protein